MHLHITSPDLAATIRFYTAFFGQPPIVQQPDYVKWEPSDFPVTLAVTEGSGGINHIGLKGEKAEAEAPSQTLTAVGFSPVEQVAAECCYVRANKSWFVDPSGIAVEIYHGTIPIEIFGTDHTPSSIGTACCENTAMPVSESRFEQRPLPRALATRLGK